MNSVQFTGLSNKNTINENNKKKAIKRAATVAVTASAVAIGGAVVYKNRNSKQVQKAVSIVKENVLEPLNKKAFLLKEKVQEGYTAIKAKIEGLKGKTEEASAPPKTPKEAPKDIQKADGPKLKKHKVQKKRAKIKKTSTKPVKTILDAAKDNAGKLKTGAAGLGAGAALGATGVGAVKKVNEISENGMDKGEKLILTSKGEEFKGYFKKGRAYNEDGTPLDDKLTYVYSGGSKLTSGVDEDEQMTFGEKRDIRKSIMTYTNGVLRKATYFSDIDTPIPTSIKHYDDAGKLINEFGAFSYANEKGQLAPGSQSSFSVIENPNGVKTPVMLKKHIIKTDGTDVYKYYKKNVDETGAIKGKPIYTFSTETKTLEDGSIQTDFYAPDTLGRGVDFLAKTAVKRPDGVTKIYMMSRNEGVYGRFDKAPINGAVTSVMTLDKHGRAVSYKLLTDEQDHNYWDGLVRLRGGKIISINDENHLIQTGRDIGEAFQYSPLKLSIAKSTDKFSEKIYESRVSTSKIGISYYDDGETVKSIATYREFSDFPDVITYFDKEGRPIQDVGYSLMGDQVLFSPKYKFDKAAPTLPDDINEARERIIQTETEALERVRAAQRQQEEEQQGTSSEVTGA